MQRFIILVVMVGVAFGCSAKSELVKEALDNAENQKPIVLRTSEDDNRPAWTKATVGEIHGRIYFSGGFVDGADYAVTIRSANAEALKSAVQAISQYIRGEFSSYVQGSNSAFDGGIERYVSDGIATFAENIHVQGIRQAEVYYEELWHPTLMQTTYNVWIRLEMSKGDYMKAKADVLRSLRDKFAVSGETEAKKKAEDLLEELKNEVKGTV